MENQTWDRTAIPATLLPEEGTGVDPVTILIKSLYGFIGVTGILGNGLILAMLIKIPALRNTTNLLIGHQSVIDFTSSCLLLATFLPPPLHDMTELWKTNPGLAQIFCKLWVSRFFYWTAIKASTANLVCLTLERFVAVVLPLKYREKLKPGEAAIICGSIWFFGIMVQVYQLPTFFIDDGKCVLRYSSPVLAVISGVWIFIMTLVLPLAVMAFVYISIFMHLPRKVSPATDDNNGHSARGTQASVIDLQEDRETPITDMLQGDAGAAKSCVPTTTSGVPPTANRNLAGYRRSKKVENKRDKVRRNVLSTMVIVSVTYAICWTPNQIYFFYFNLGGELDLNGGLYSCTVLAAAANMCINPIIYSFKYKKFQDGMKQMLCGRSRAFQQTNDSTAGS